MLPPLPSFPAREVAQAGEDGLILLVSVFIEPPPKNPTELLSCPFSFQSSQKSCGNRIYHPHFTAEETEAERGKMTSPTSKSQNQVSNPCLSD